MQNLKNLTIRYQDLTFTGSEVFEFFRQHLEFRGPKGKQKSKIKRWISDFGVIDWSGDDSSRYPANLPFEMDFDPFKRKQIIKTPEGVEIGECGTDCFPEESSDMYEYFRFNIPLADDSTEDNRIPHPVFLQWIRRSQGSENGGLPENSMGVVYDEDLEIFQKLRSGKVVFALVSEKDLDTTLENIEKLRFELGSNELKAEETFYLENYDLILDRIVGYENGEWKTRNRCARDKTVLSIRYDPDQAIFII